jgi:acyl-CoA thioesterase
METSPTESGFFDRDTELVPGAGGELEGSISHRWDARGGPHGGYVAALILRGMTIAIADASRAPLTLTVQFVSRPAFGPVTVDTTVERTGRSLTTMSARLVQAGVPVALAMSAFATAMPGLEFDELPIPAVDAPWADRRSVTSDQAPPFVRNFVLQPRFEPPFQGGHVPMVAGGWTGVAGRRPLDALALALISDAWFSPPWTRLKHPVPSPTISLSVYFRSRLPRPKADSEDLCLARFESALVRDGCFQTDGTMWTVDGTVLAQSHQLQLLTAA